MLYHIWAVLNLCHLTFAIRKKKVCLFEVTMAENIQNIHIFITENQSEIWAIFHGGLMFAVCELREWYQNHNNRLLWKFWGPLSAPDLSRTKGVTGESKEVPGNGGVKAGHERLKLGQTGTCLLGAHPSQNSEQRRTQQWMVLSQEVLIQTCHFPKQQQQVSERQQFCFTV